MSGSNGLLSLLQEIDEYQFERLVADLWSAQGWHTEVTQGSNDGGIDVIATKNEVFPEKQLIQAKRYASGTTVGSPQIQQYASLQRQEPDADSVVVVTTSSFSSQALRTASKLNVKTVDGHELCRLLDKYGDEELLRRYGVAGSNGEKSSRKMSGNGRSSAASDGASQSSVVTWRERNRDQARHHSESTTDQSTDVKPITTIVGEKLDDRDFDPTELDLNNRCWLFTKISVATPLVGFLTMFLAFVAIGAYYGGPEAPEADAALNVMLLLWFLSIPLSAVVFSISVSKDKEWLVQETGYGDTAHPITVFVALLFTGGLYAIARIFGRWATFS